MILNASQPITEENGTMTQVFRTWALEQSDTVPIVGAGSPEGNVDANQFRLYIDSTGTTGAIEWRKMLADIAGDTKMGWVLV